MKKLAAKAEKKGATNAKKRGKNEEEFPRFALFSKKKKTKQNKTNKQKNKGLALSFFG